MTYQAKHVIDSRQFTLPFLERLFARADEFIKYMESGNRASFPTYSKTRMEQYYWQPSTRTAGSFGRAANIIGMSDVYYQNAGEFSSFAKGESLVHGVQATDSNHDILVIRHSLPGVPYIASLVSTTPVINAGDGDNQHPTQALLDIYNIHDYFDTINGLNIVFVGECDGRVTRSLAYLLAKHGKDNKFFFVAPKEFQANEKFLTYLNKKGVRYTCIENLEDVIEEGDVFYSTRLRKERMDEIKIIEMEKNLGRKLTSEEIKQARSKAEEDYLELRKTAYPKTVIDERRLSGMREGAIIMHPLPIDREKSDGHPEITEEVDMNRRATYLKESNEGWAIRAVLSEALITGNEIADHLDDPNFEKIWRDIYRGDPEYSPHRLRLRLEWKINEREEKLRRIKRRDAKRSYSLIA